MKKDSNTTLTYSSDGESLVLKFYGMWSTSSLALLSGPLWAGMVVPIGPTYKSNRTVYLLNWKPFNLQIELFELNSST